MRKLTIMGTLAAAAVIASTVTAVDAHATAAARSSGVTLGPSSITWGTCDNSTGLGGVPNAECALVPVPLDYANPSAGTIKLAVSRIRHTVPDSQFQGVMLVNPGGPGSSGQYLSILGQFVPGGVGNDYDWIGFDPRGVGNSEPRLSCDPTYFNFARPAYIPVQASTEQQWLARSAGYDAACQASNGPILNHLTTVDSAKDMDSIRKALGAKQINYYGFSYGTYLGQVYSTLYPTHVRREVLDSNVDPRQVWYAANLDQDVAFDKNMNIWFGWLAKYNSVYHLGATQTEVKTLFYKIESKLTFQPADGLIGQSEWVDTFLGAGYYEQTWLDLGGLFAAYVHNNDVADLEAAYLSANGFGDDNGFAVYNGVQCTDIQWPTSWKKWEDDNWNTFAKAPFETWGNAWYNAPCLHWPAPAQRGTPFVVDGSKVSSALLIDEELDAATPFPGSLEVRSLFPHSSLIAEPGGTSHADSLFGDACVDDQIAAYLADGTLPTRKAGSGPDTLCAPLPVPVPTAAAAKPAVANSAAGAVSGSKAALTALRLRMMRQLARP